MRGLAVVVGLGLFVASAVQAALPGHAQHVKAELLSDTKSVQPGKPFTVGVRLKIDPNWHVYWQHPGESGQETEVTFKAPEGFTVGKLNYPVPTRFVQPGDIIGYGYKDEVMLTAEVTPPATLKPGTPVPIEANVNWLVCEDLCIPGKAKLAAQLTAGDTAVSDNAELFAKWKSQLPVSPEASGVVEKVESNGNADPVQVVITWRESPNDVQWFIDEPSEVMLKDVKTETSGNRSTLTFRPQPAPGEATEVPIVVAFKDSQGNRRGVETKVSVGPVQPPQPVSAAGK